MGLDEVHATMRRSTPYLSDPSVARFLRLDARVRVVEQICLWDRDAGEHESIPITQVKTRSEGTSRCEPTPGLNQDRHHGFLHRRSSALRAHRGDGVYVVNPVFLLVGVKPNVRNRLARAFDLGVHSHSWPRHPRRRRRAVGPTDPRKKEMKRLDFV